MSSLRPDAQPIIIEPTATPIQNPEILRPSSAQASLDTNSSSTSFNSSRSPSPSLMSQSTPSPPILGSTGYPENGQSLELSEVSPRPLPTVAPPSTRAPSTGQRQACGNDPPRSIPSERRHTIVPGFRWSWSALRTWLFGTSWFQNALGVITLVLTLIGLLIFGYRTYKLGIYSSYGTYLQLCQGQVQVIIALSGL